MNKEAEVELQELVLDFTREFSELEFEIGLTEKQKGTFEKAKQTLAELTKLALRGGNK
jgi:hypothetical protein